MKEIHEMEVYRLAERLSDMVWNTYDSWDFKAQKTMGIQIIRSSDSIAANIAEGYGRYHFQENIQFCRISRGSMYETQDHLITCLDNEYIAQEEYKSIWDISENAIRVLDGYIRYLKKQQRGELR